MKQIVGKETREQISDQFTDCQTLEEVAELYAEFRFCLQEQLKVAIDYFVDTED